MKYDEERKMVHSAKQEREQARQLTMEDGAAAPTCSQ